MARERSAKSPHRSLYVDAWVSAAQHLAELMCGRIARKQSTSLAGPFWQDGPWKKTFLAQCRHANALLKAYSLQAILEALEGPQGRSVYSLGAKWLDELVAARQAILDRREAILVEQSPVEPVGPVPGGPQGPRPVQKKPSLLGQLRELERGEKG